MRYFVFVLALLTIYPAATHLAAYEENNGIEEDNKVVLFDDAADERRLFAAVQCPGGGPLSSFYLDIDMIPQGGFNTSKCTAENVTNMGPQLNALLYNYGVGPAGVGDNAVYLAEVCSTPLARRRLATLKRYRYPGGGTCRKCVGDNQDKRRLQTNYDPNWFVNIYAPELENKLRKAITNTFVKNFTACLGNGPRVNVEVYPVPSVTFVTC